MNPEKIADFFFVHFHNPGPGKWKLTLFAEVEIPTGPRMYMNEPATETRRDKLLEEEIETTSRDEARYRFFRSVLKHNMMVTPSTEAVMEAHCAQYEAAHGRPS